MTTYLNHITLNTGHLRRSPRAEVADDTLATIAPWLDAAIEAGQAVPLPHPSIAAYTAVAITDIGLVVTVYAAASREMPLVTFGVAERSRQGAELWPKLCAHFGAAPGLHKPSEPWCAVATHPALVFDPAVEWLGDFERCVAWAWLARPRQGDGE